MRYPLARLIFSLLLMSFILSPVHAGMIGTDELLNQAPREQLLSELDKQDVQQKLVEMGVDPDDAKERVKVMTDTEIASLSQQIEALPAGGQVSNKLIAIILIILVLLAI